MKCDEIIKKLESLSPASFAEEWDNVGLLAGRRDKEVSTVYIALVYLNPQAPLSFGTFSSPGSDQWPNTCTNTTAWKHPRSSIVSKGTGHLQQKGHRISEVTRDTEGLT